MTNLLNRPSQCAHNVDAVFVDALEHFTEEELVVEGAFEVVALGFDGLRGWVSVDEKHELRPDLIMLEDLLTWVYSMYGKNPNSETTIAGKKSQYIFVAGLEHITPRDNIPLGLNVFQT
jgi:hypothetical protein